MKHRGNGQGTAQKVGYKNYKAIATIGYKCDANGNLDYSKPIRKCKSGFATKTEALEYVKVLKAEKSEACNYKTLRQIFNEWIECSGKGEKTKTSYTSMFKSIKCADVKSNNLSLQMIQKEFSDNSLSRVTQAMKLSLLNQLWLFATPRNYIPADKDFLKYVVISGRKSVSKNAFTAEELKLIQDSMGKVKYADWIYANCYMGFRISELTALKCSDYDAENHIFVGGTKTEAGKNRKVPVCSKILPIIERLIKEAHGGYVFGSYGKKISTQTYIVGFLSALEEIGIDNPAIKGSNIHKYTPHTCRHTFATMLKKVNGNTKDKLEIIGHTNEKMLMHYQDVSVEDIKFIAEKLCDV